MSKRRPYVRSGFHALRRRVAVAGMDAIDRRTLGGRELMAWWQNQVAHLGGKDEITHPEATLVKRAGVLEILIRQAEADLLSRGVLVGRRKATRPHPLLSDYRALLREQREILNLLGLKRRAKSIKSLPEILARYERDDEPGAQREAGDAAATQPGDREPAR